MIRHFERQREIFYCGLYIISETRHFHPLGINPCGRNDKTESRRDPMAQSSARQHDCDIFAGETRFNRWPPLGIKLNIHPMPAGIQIQRYEDLIILA